MTLPKVPESMGHTSCIERISKISAGTQDFLHASSPVTYFISWQGSKLRGNLPESVRLNAQVARICDTLQYGGRVSRGLVDMRGMPQMYDSSTTTNYLKALEFVKINHH